MHHSAACIAASERLEAANAAYKKEWPDYCRSCGGHGGFSSPGCSVPYGATYVSLPDDYDPCPDCWEDGGCPRCGKEIMSREAAEEGAEIPEVCPHCGWKDGDPGLQEEDICACAFYVDEEGWAKQDLEEFWIRAGMALADWWWAHKGGASWNEKPSEERYAEAIKAALNAVPRCNVVFD